MFARKYFFFLIMLLGFYYFNYVPHSIGIDLVKHLLSNIKAIVMSQLPVNASQLNPVMRATMTSNAATKGKGFRSA
jgi:hypothetical protein